jgi:hypothetical protein
MHRKFDVFVFVMGLAAVFHVKVRVKTREDVVAKTRGLVLGAVVQLGETNDSKGCALATLPPRCTTPGRLVCDVTLCWRWVAADFLESPWWVNADREL